MVARGNLLCHLCHSVTSVTSIPCHPARLFVQLWQDVAPQMSFGEFRTIPQTLILHWNGGQALVRLPRDVVGSPSLEVFKNLLDFGCGPL